MHISCKRSYRLLKPAMENPVLTEKRKSGACAVADSAGISHSMTGPAAQRLS